MWNKIYYWSEKNLIINHKYKIKAASSDERDLAVHKCRVRLPGPIAWLLCTIC